MSRGAFQQRSRRYLDRSRHRGAPFDVRHSRRARGTREASRYARRDTGPGSTRQPSLGLVVSVVSRQRRACGGSYCGGGAGYAELDALDKAYLAGLSRWVDGACTTLTCGHKFMSSLAMTSINADTYDDIHVPWPALLVHIPNGSIPIHSWEATKIRFSFLRKAVRVAGTSGLSDVATISVVTTEASGGLLHCSRWGDDALSRCLFDEGTVDESLDSEESRVLRAAQRIVVGLLYTLQYSTRWSERVWDRKGNDDPRNGPPKHRVICFGQPVATDTRASLRDWIRHGSGGGAPPSVQSLVRGHYKRQVIGVGRTGRKVIWVEPYWRGPEDAPILARPYKVGGNHDQAP